MPRKPKLPNLLDRKIYKTGQTRGADLEAIYQNRVSRNSTAVIRFENFERYKLVREMHYENGYVVVINPEIYFDNYSRLEALNLSLGENLLIFYQKRNEWEKWNPQKLNLNVASNRTSPLGGDYVARIAGTTSIANKKANPIREGFNKTDLRGLGIREYEYASKETIDNCRLQLAYLYWKSNHAIEEAVKSGMSLSDASTHKEWCQIECEKRSLIDKKLLIQKRFINSDEKLVCPLCLETMDASAFYSRVVQAEGRETHDQTVTEISLFHLDELRPGKFNHKEYNLGWGHYHCNVVVKDSGIEESLKWMQKVVNKNKEYLAYVDKDNC